nr:MBL fold metallo-hydrolase [Lachnospiraceae bacterium]
DCGMQQGPDIYENQELSVDASKIDYVLLTHAHIDHSGLLPLLYSHGFRGEIYATTATVMLCDIMLKDSAHIQMSEAEWKNRKARRSGRQEISPLYNMTDAENVLKHFKSCDYHKKIDICDELSIRFVDAGHLLGSSSIEVWLSEGNETKKVVFSGDIGHGNKPLIKNPEFINEADYVLIESTYGDRVHNVPPDFAKALAEIIGETLSRGGNVVIPAFSVGRTQELLYFIRRIKEEKMLPDMQNFEVYVDSPLSVEATHIFTQNVEDCYDDEALEIVKKGGNPIWFDGLKVSVSSEDSKMINQEKSPKVIVSASGMCEAGRIRHHLKHNLWRGECTILFVGYQVVGTLGHTLLNGAKEVRLFGETINVNAEIKNLPGISGHADRNMLLEWISKVDSPFKVFVVHGEDKICDNFAMDIRNIYGFDAYAPYSGDEFDLISGKQLSVGPRIVRSKKKTGSKASSNVFARLVAAGKRLMSFIEKSEGMANKDLGKMADQVNSLVDKWEK